MTKLTKNELVAINADLAKQNDDLRHRVAQLEADIVRITEVASTVNRMQRPQYQMPAWQIERRQKMEAAKQAALASKRCVKVGFDLEPPFNEDVR
jgi:uncharacterized protein YigA (DUF484 family)